MADRPDQHRLVGTPALKWEYGYYVGLGGILDICGVLYWRFDRNGWLSQRLCCRPEAARAPMRWMDRELLAGFSLCPTP